MASQPTSPIPRAVVLLSGGLDSAVALAAARADGFECSAISFNYSQRHAAELAAARRVAASLGVPPHRHTVLAINLRAVGGSALTDSALDVPKNRAAHELAAGIPITYVPARNLIFLSCAAAYAETIGARTLYIGVNAIDYSGYPDCREPFIRAFEEAANLGTRAGTSGHGFDVRTPLQRLTKAQIIQHGANLGVDFSLTHSCYDPVGPQGLACGTCDSCTIRRSGFADAGVPDPTRYA